ncbi:MAG: FAD binding domain-containing protein [Chloroflexi bacterium]|nr:FAD binding domain-containing protein [Chloroflexota bacterium]
MSTPLSYHRPENLNDARKLLADDGSRPLLIHPRMDVEPYSTADAVVDLSLLNLNTIQQEGDVIRIGALTTLQDVADSPLLRTLARGILPEAASLTAHLGLRNVSTIGGVMMNPQSAVDVMLALLCLGVGAQTRVDVGAQGRVEVGAQTRVDVGAHGRAPLQNEISFSVSSSARAALERIARTSHDAPIVAICALKDKNVTRVAVGGVGISPMLVDPAKAQESVSPVADFRGSVEYQREMVGVLVKRVMKRVETL